MKRFRGISVVLCALLSVLTMSGNVALQPTDVYMTGGHRQTITYDGFGNKKRTDYSVGPETVIGGDIPADDAYAVTSSRVYVGSHVFADGKLEYSGFAGGYFDPTKGAMYYITDWQGNNIAVVDSKGKTAQHATYYPYGEPTVEPKGQRYLFGGKEREHAGGRNTYDFGARSLTPYGIWPSPDPLAEKYYNLSPYSYCGGDPINRIDKDGREWTITEEENGNEELIKLKISGVLINLSSQKYDLSKLSVAINQQLENIYTINFGGVQTTMEADIRAITVNEEIAKSDHVIAIVDVVNSENGALASTDRPCGLRIKIGNEVALQTITGENTRTIAHEIGHSGGLNHTNKNTDKDSNLMTQLPYISKGVDFNSARHLSYEQIRTIVDNYKNGELNNHFTTSALKNILWPFDYWYNISK